MLEILQRGMDCIVVGAGVSGLSSGIRLLEDGYKVTIVADSLSPDTVSDKAAAWWYPFLAEPVEKTNRWSTESLTEFILSLIHI